jgi:DNA repair protein RadC
MQVDLFNNLVCEVEAVYRPFIKPSRNPKISTPDDIVNYVRPAYTDIIDYYERASALYVNNTNHIIALMKLSEGSLKSAIIDPARVFQMALKLNAQGIVIIHNHPSGSLKPSKSDKEITTRIKSGADLLGFKLLDHIILTHDSYYSFTDNGVL